jgi:hypothetical protein
MSYFQRATLMISQRSQSQEVKKIIKSLIQRCEAIEESIKLSQIPLEDCMMLANLTNDAFYRVIVFSEQGVSVLVKTMQRFKYHAGLQEACCISLGNLCMSKTMSINVIEEENVVKQIVMAMKIHPNSFALQSAAHSALRLVSDLLVRTLPYLPRLALEINDAILTV